jgi:multiple sugar transport system permease protein
VQPAPVVTARTPGARRRPTRTRRQRLPNLVLTVLALAFVALWAFPYLYMVLSSFKTPVDNIAVPPKFVFTPTLDNFREVLGNADIIRFLRNSIIVATASTAVALMLAIPAAYGLVRFERFRRTERVAYLFLILQLLPIIAVVFPYFALANRFNLRDTPWILIITYTYWNVAWGIWLIRGFIESVPKELDEAAMVDGCSRLRALVTVTLPVAAKGIVAAAILLFIGAWNEFTLAFFLTARSARTYPTSIGFFLTHSGIRWGEMFVTATIGTLPIVIFALLVRKSFISSMSFGAVKG